MKYITRQIEDLFLESSSFFKAVMLTGPRQVGKTCMLKHLCEKSKRTYVSLDDDVICNVAQKDPSLFFQMYKTPILIDEVQKAPQLFNQIKKICDESEDTGLFWLTGSQKFDLLKQASETLTGRIGILNLYGFSTSELLENKSQIEFNKDLLKERELNSDISDITQIFDRIYRGGYPMAISASDKMRIAYFNSYIDTYLIRDVLETSGISDVFKFKQFLRACAALTGNLVNFATLANSVGISQPTAKTWLGILVNLGIVFLLEPYSNNIMNSLVRTPKLYFWDTGLCAYLCGWEDPNTLCLGPSAGAFFENYVISEIRKSRIYSGKQSSFFFYRDKNGNEIDLVMQENQNVIPIEIKKTASPQLSMTKSFHLLKVNSPLQIQDGFVICSQPKIIPLSENITSIPVGLI